MVVLTEDISERDEEFEPASLSAESDLEDELYECSIHSQRTTPRTKFHKFLERMSVAIHT